MKSMMLGGASAQASALPPAVLAALNQLCALNPAVLSTLTATLCQLACMPITSFAFVVRNGDGTSDVQELPAAAGTFQVSIDAAGKLTWKNAPLVGDQRIGTISFAGTELVGSTKDVTFSTPMPSADYIVQPVMQGLAGMWTVVANSQAKEGFKLKIVSTIQGVTGYEAKQKV